MSKWNRSMRQYQPARLVCCVCAQSLKPGRYGGWEHVQRVGIKSPGWHIAEMAA